MNVKNILCPIDFSSHSNAALAYASKLAKESGATLHIVYAYEEPIAYVEEDMGSFPPPADLEPDKASLEATSPTTDVPFRREFLIGAPSSALVNYAAQCEIDLIVMGTHGRMGLNRLLMGSVAESVLRKATCPVLTIKIPQQESTDASNQSVPEMA